jgi:small subunit ribosomal protein S21
MNGVCGEMHVEALLRKFKKVMDKADIISEIKKRQHYEKPSAIRRRKLKDAIRRHEMDMRNMDSGYKRNFYR